MTRKFLTQSSTEASGTKNACKNKKKPFTIVKPGQDRTFICDGDIFPCRKIAPTLLLDVPHDSLIMDEEIFGPLLPIITVRGPVYLAILYTSMFLAFVGNPVDRIQK